MNSRIPGLVSGVCSENAHCRGVLAGKTAILRATLANYVASGKLTGRESIIAFRAEKENNPVCFGGYSDWIPCPATRRKEWKPACKLCKKLYHIRRSI